MLYNSNSNGRRKTMIVSVLAFLFIGGGVFMFFILQGADDLTGAKKNTFSYGGAARQGVASFFKSMGVISDDEEKLAKQKEVRTDAREFLADGGKADIADWMDKSAKAPSSSSGLRPPPRSAVVPRMSAGGMSSVGGGGGGTKSAGGASRFGGGAGSDNTKISARAQTGAGDGSGKGTLAALRNARSLLGEGLRSGSAMTASSKWNQSFGVGGGNKGSDLAYNKAGLISLDKIKKGEIASLKGGPVPEAGAFQRDKEAEKQDKGIQAAQAAADEKSKADAEAELKKAAAKAALDGLDKGLNSGNTPKDSSPGDSGTDPGQKPITPEEKDQARNFAVFKKTDLGDGSTMQDQKVDITRLPDGGAQFAISGVMTVPPDTTPVPYTDYYIRGTDGSLTPKP